MAHKITLPNGRSRINRRWTGASPRSTKLDTTAAAIQALGGIEAVMRLTGNPYKTVWNWTQFPTFPSGEYVTMTRAIEALGMSAPPSLWRQGSPRSHRR
jgi:hypothetical protein